MLFPSKPRFLIDNDLIFRCERLVCDNDIVHTERKFQWNYGHLYEVRYTTSVKIYKVGDSIPDLSIHNIFCIGHTTFDIGDRIVCVQAMNYHSINGLEDMYLDYEIIRYKIEGPYRNIPDTMFAEIVILNELEYIDYLYGRDQL